jgi:hypothetical protein
VDWPTESGAPTRGAALRGSLPALHVGGRRPQLAPRETASTLRLVSFRWKQMCIRSSFGRAGPNRSWRRRGRSENGEACYGSAGKVAAGWQDGWYSPRKHAVAIGWLAPPGFNCTVLLSFPSSSRNQNAAGYTVALHCDRSAASGSRLRHHQPGTLLHSIRYILGYIKITKLKI